METALDQETFVRKASELVSVDIAGLQASVAGAHLTAQSLPELRTAMAGAVYSRLHARNPELDNVPSSLDQDLAPALIATIGHRTVSQAVEIVEQVPTEAGRTSRIVRVQGVKVLVSAQDLTPTEHDDRALLTAPSWRERTTPGFLLALGPHGPLNQTKIARLYIAAASGRRGLEVWKQLLPALSAAQVPYQAKALSASISYPRSDAIVVYLDLDHLAQVVAALAPIFAGSDQANQATPQQSLFTVPVLPGVGLAQEPADTRVTHQHLSFGQHRSRVLVDALIRSATDEIPVDEAWQHECAQAGVNPDSPGLNLTDFPLATQ